VSGRVKKRRKDRSLVGCSYDPEKIRFAHELFVMHRLGFAQIAMAMKRRFGIGTTVKTLSATISKWAKADPIRTADGREIGYWYHEREEQIRREIALRHEGDELYDELNYIVREIASRFRNNLDESKGKKKGKVSANLLSSLTRAIKELYKVHEIRKRESDKNILISGNAEFELFLGALESVLGPTETKRIMPEVIRIYKRRANEYGVKIEDELVSAQPAAAVH